MGSKVRVEVDCYCCDTMQLVQDHLREAVKDASQGRQVYEGLSQLLHLVREANLRCNHVHRTARVGAHAANSAGDVVGQIFLEHYLEPKGE